MPATPRAHLLLPSPQGLLRYDLLEETAFLGPAAKGGVTASAAPFPQAKVLLSDGGQGYAVRSLPGEPPPEVNGAPGDGAILKDGDRVRVGDQVVLYRADALQVPAVAPTGQAQAQVPGEPPRPRRPAGQAPMPPGARQGARALYLAAGLVLVLATYQAVRYLQTPPAGPVQQVPSAFLAPREAVPPLPERQAEKDYAAALAHEREHADDVEGIAARYAGVAKRHQGTAAGLQAEADYGRTRERLAAKVWADVQPTIEADARSGRYRRALEAVDAFERRHGDTAAAVEAVARRDTLRTAARAAFDALQARVAPLLASDATRAYRALTASGIEFPPDIDAELAALLGRVREAWAKPPPPPPEPSQPPPGRVAKPGERPGFRPLDRPPEEPTPPGPPTVPAADAAARALWDQALADLRAGRHAEALKGFDAVASQHGDAPCVAAHGDRLRACRQAADFGLRGPAALLAAEATWKQGRLEAEWTFESDQAFLQDFAVEQPFMGEATAQAEVREGYAILSGSTAMMLKVVFDPSSVSWEIDGVTDEPRDFGVVGFQEGREYRAVAMHAGNTQFKLKKGPAAKVLTGHVLWLFGDGVWKDADPGERGFVRIAAESGNRLKGGERILVRCALDAGQAVGEIQGKGEKVRLSGPLKGDDGRGLGPLRVGAFAYNGRVGVERFKVSGKVDEAWRKAKEAEFVGSARGPE